MLSWQQMNHEPYEEEEKMEHDEAMTRKLTYKKVIEDWIHCGIWGRHIGVTSTNMENHARCRELHSSTIGKKIINNSHWISSARNWIFCVLSIFWANAVLVFVSLSSSFSYLIFVFSNLNLKLQFKNQLVTICSMYLIHFIIISSFLLWGAKLCY